MKLKIKKFSILFLSLIVAFSFVLAKENKNKKGLKVKPVKIKTEKVEIKYKPKKKEVKIYEFSEKQFDDFKNLDETEEIAEHPSAEFFMLHPSGYTVQQGNVDSYKDNILTVNSLGFKVNWNITTNTDIIASRKLKLSSQDNLHSMDASEISTGTKVKIFGIWDGDKFLANKIITLQIKKPEIELKDLIEKIQEILENKGIKIDLTPLLQKVE